MSHGLPRRDLLRLATAASGAPGWQPALRRALRWFPRRRLPTGRARHHPLRRAAGVVAFLVIWGVPFFLQRLNLGVLRDTSARFPTPPDEP